MPKATVFCTENKLTIPGQGLYEKGYLRSKRNDTKTVGCLGLVVLCDGDASILVNTSPDSKGVFVDVLPFDAEKLASTQSGE